MSSFRDLNIIGLKDPNDLNIERCLIPDEFMDFNHPDVQSQIHKLSDGLDDPWNIAKAIFYFIRDKIAYDFAPPITGPENWRSSFILKEKRGFCHQKSILQASLYRAAGIPSALTYQNVVDYPLLKTRYKKIITDGILSYHGLPVIFINDTWIRQDATLDSGLCIRRGYRITKVRKGRETLLPKITTDSKPHFKIQKEHGYFEAFDPLFRDGLLSNLPAWNEWRSFVKKEHLSM